ncbi:MAG: type II CAAX endopeptidase family protein [Anaerolineales bacterium]
MLFRHVDLSSSPLLEGARQARRLPHGLIVLLVGAVLPFFAAIPFVLPLVLLFGLFPSAAHPFLQVIRQVASLILSFGGIFVLLWLWLRWVERRAFATLGFLRQSALPAYGRGFLVGVILIGVVVFLLWLLGAEITLVSVTTPWWWRVMAAFLLLPAWMVQGAAEETLLRGWVLPVISVRHGLAIGLAASVILFAALHAFNPGLTPLALVNLALFGLFAALYALREGTLWGVCACHSAWNWALGSVLGLAVSGGEFEQGILNLQINGPEWITGGAFGPEGGLVTTIALLLALGWLFSRRRML